MDEAAPRKGELEFLKHPDDDRAPGSDAVKPNADSEAALPPSR